MLTRRCSTSPASPRLVRIFSISARSSDSSAKPWDCKASRGLSMSRRRNSGCSIARRTTAPIISLRMLALPPGREGARHRPRSTIVVDVFTMHVERWPLRPPTGGMVGSACSAALAPAPLRMTLGTDHTKGRWPKRPPLHWSSRHSHAPADGDQGFALVDLVEFRADVVLGVFERDVQAVLHADAHSGVQ